MPQWLHNALFGIGLSLILAAAAAGILTGLYAAFYLLSTIVRSTLS